MKRMYLAIPLALYALAALPVRYAADDWCEALWSRRFGLGAVRYLYDQWTGKYTYALQIGLLKGVAFPGWTALVALAVWVFALWLLLRSLDAALVIPVVMIAAAPTPGESFFWQSGAFGYATGLALATGLFAAVVRDKRLVALLLAFPTAGTTDTMAVVLPVALVVLVALGYRRAGVAALAGALVGLAIMIAAPGNAVRQAYFPGSTPILAALYSVRTAGVPVAHALQASPLVLVAALVVPALTGVRLQTEVKRTAVILLVGVLAVGAAAEFASYFPTGTPLTLRAEPIPVYFTLLAGLALSALAGQSFALCRPRLARRLVVGIVLVCAIQAATFARQMGTHGLGISSEGYEACMTVYQ